MAYNPSVVYPALPMWHRALFNVKFSAQARYANRKVNDNPDSCNEYHAIFSFCPMRYITVSRNQNGRFLYTTHSHPEELPLPPSQEDCTTREEFAFYFFQRDECFPPIPIEFGQEEFNNVFRYTYKTIQEVLAQNRDQGFRLFLDGDKLNENSENIFVIHTADALTCFGRTDQSSYRGHLELFDDFRQDHIVYIFLNYNLDVFWFLFGIAENTSDLPIAVEPLSKSMPAAHLIFEHDHFQHFQRVKQILSQTDVDG